MKSFTSVVPLAFLAISSFTHIGATPIAVNKRDNPTETQILQYALTLEHLEDTFYSGALAQFNEAAFENAGFPPWVRGRIAQIRQHESAHVQFLTNTLGSEAVAACEYNFPYTDPKSFVSLSQVLEGVGTSAYLGAAQFLPDPSVLTAAGAILTTEARHDAWVGSAARKGTPWSGALDTPLDQNLVFTLASAFITRCPESNPQLPFKAFPALTISNSRSADTLPSPGEKVTLTYNSTQSETTSGSQFLVLFTGLSTQFAKIDNMEATLPEGLQGTVYAVVSSNGTAVTDDSTIAGPVILSFPFSSSATNP